MIESEYKLYRITLKGMTYSTTGVVYGISYAIAKDSAEAYKKVRTFLDDEDIGFSGNRVLDKIELIAESKHYPECHTILFDKE